MHLFNLLMSVLFSLVMLCAPVHAQEKIFYGEGSDTFMGIGGRYLGLGGTGAAISNDIYALFYNPAGLASIEGFEFSIARQLNARLLPINFAAAAVRLPFFDRYGISTVAAAGYIPRLNFYGEGEFGADDLESVFLRYAIPGLVGDFDGIISSKTKDFRIALAFSPLNSDRWALGFSVGRVDCATYSCGVSAQRSDGYTIVSTEAVAYTLNLGARLKISGDFILGVSVKDVNTKLDVSIQTTDDNGVRDQVLQTGFPTDITVGLLWNYSDRLTLTADYQTMFGSYGTYDIDVKMLRFGAEKRYGKIMARTGLIVPITISSSELPEIVLPFPVAPTFGIGWQDERLSIDIAVYGHPLMSYSRNSIQLAADLSISYRF